MRRRTFMASALGLAVLPKIAAAQRPAKVFRIGWITATSKGATAPFVDAFQNGLAELGYAVGRNAVVEARYGDDDIGRLQSLADELLRIPVDVLLAHGPGSGIVVGRAGPVPVVYVISGDPVEAGIAHSLARPGGNATGITLMSVELNGKRLELLRSGSRSTGCPPALPWRRAP
jgi:putative ABC transport system substrate-binding protein